MVPKSQTFLSQLKKRLYPIQMHQPITCNHFDLDQSNSWIILGCPFLQPKFCSIFGCRFCVPKIIHEFDWSRSKRLHVFGWYICIGYYSRFFSCGFGHDLVPPNCITFLILQVCIIFLHVFKIGDLETTISVNIQDTRTVNQWYLSVKKRLYSKSCHGNFLTTYKPLILKTQSILYMDPYRLRNHLYIILSYKKSHLCWWWTWKQTIRIGNWDTSTRNSCKRYAVFPTFFESSADHLNMLFDLMVGIALYLMLLWTIGEFRQTLQMWYRRQSTSRYGRHWTSVVEPLIAITAYTSRQ